MNKIAKEDLDVIRDKLLQESRTQPAEQKSGYVNGVLDFYIEVKDALTAQAVQERRKEGEVRI